MHYDTEVLGHHQGEDEGSEIELSNHFEYEAVLGVAEDTTDDIAEYYRIYITRDNPLLRYVINDQVEQVRIWLDDALRRHDERWMHAFFTTDVSNKICLYC